MAIASPNPTFTYPSTAYFTDATAANEFALPWIQRMRLENITSGNDVYHHGREYDLCNRDNYDHGDTGRDHGPVTVVDSTHMTVQMTANAGASFQPYSLLAITGSEEAVLPNGLSMVAGAGGNLIANNGFELPTMASGGYQYTPTDPTGSWVFDTGSGVSQNGTAFTSNNSSAPDGNQVAFIQGTGTIRQTVSGLTPGVSYALTFSASGRVGYAPQSIDLRIANSDGSGTEDPGRLFVWQQRSGLLFLYDTGFCAGKRHAADHDYRAGAGGDARCYAFSG